MVKALTVYKASAGSGKTFTLATEYIRLLVEDPTSYRNILAVTFTNKATEEMKMRILSQLFGIWKGLPESADYLSKIQEATGYEPRFISERAGIALHNLLHNYNYFRVETIDTFFQSILRNMARELDLTNNLRIGLNDNQVEEMAIDQLIADLSTTDVVLQWILKYIMESISDDKSWNVISHIKIFGKTIFKDEYKQVSQELEKKFSEPGFFEDYTRRLRELRKSAADHMKEIAETFFDTIEGEGFGIEDFSNGSKGVCGIFLKLRQGIFDESIIGKRVADAAGDPKKWYRKDHPRREAIHMLVDSSLNKLLQYAIEERPRQWKLYKSADLTLRHLNQVRLLGCIEKKVHELNQDANRFLLSDTQQLLHSLIGESDSPFIFEKIGTQIKHVMIDEFQDTSTIQWQNFKVLLSEAMSHEGSQNLIVGDVKQSIYRWRSGDWRLLNDIEQQFNESQIDTKPLSTNYRSERNIITFNNIFFQEAAEQEYRSQQTINEAEAEQLQRAYKDVSQEIPKRRKDSGYVNIELLPAEDYQEQMLEKLAATIGDLMSRSVKQQEIAILVRSNKLIPVIANYFMREMPHVSIVSDEAFRLDASNAVCLIIHALRLLIEPDNQLEKAAVLKSYLRNINETYSNDNEILLSTTDLDMLLPEAYIQHFDELLTLPLYDLVERLYSIFGLEKLSTQSAYVSAFYDHLTEYVRENATDISDFLNEWDETLYKKTIQSDETDGVRIYSIHKSKGLEYDHVIIPFCDWPLEKYSDNILWCEPSEVPFSDLPLAPIDYSPKQMMGTTYEADYLHEHLQNTVDNLNLLYVGFTRACKSLFVIGKRNSKSTRSALIEACLPLVAKHKAMEGCTLEGEEDSSASLCFSYGELPESAGPAKVKEVGSNPFLQPSEALPVTVRTFERKVTFQQSNRSQDFINEESGADQQQRHYIQAGSVLHEIFSTIRTTEDIPSALEKLQSEGILYDEDITAEKITTMLKKRLEHPKVAEWFSPRWTLFNECTILTMEDDQVKEKRPDRVMTDGKQWIVVDFKFGSAKPEYQQQVREYMQLLESMGHQNIKGYLWYVYSNKIEEV